MKRTTFLRSLGLGAFIVPLGINQTTNPPISTACETTSSDTPGPFPTKNPDTLIRADVRGDRTGIPLDVELTILDKSNGCEPLVNAAVDIWHCDKDGLYSEYGGIRLQREDLSNEHFLRGRQVTDANGKVAFSSVFPGWYPGRSTHIHYEVFSPDGESILISQIAFPEGPDSAVARVNAAKDLGYTKGLEGYTANTKDGVFRDGVETQIAHISGSISEGYALTHSIII